MGECWQDERELNSVLAAAGFDALPDNTADVRNSAGSLGDLLSIWGLTWNEEGFDEFAFTAQDEKRKSLEPLALGHIRFGIQPAREQDDLVCRNVPLTHPSQKVNKQRLS